MGPRARLDAVEKRKRSLAPAGNRTPVVQPIARRYSKPKRLQRCEMYLKALRQRITTGFCGHGDEQISFLN
jgi:hypothetical protein